MVSSRSAWDNLSTDMIITMSGVNNDPAANFPPGIADGHNSVEACRNACTEDQSCLQFSWVQGECRLSRVVKFGRPDDDSAKDGEGKGEMTSGWLTERIKAWMEVNECRDGPRWILAKEDEVKEEEKGDEGDKDEKEEEKENREVKGQDGEETASGNKPA